jgi:polyhydroxyalkanoate synthesis regulator phasin
LTDNRTERQRYFALPADTNHPGHPTNELGKNPDAAAAYWYRRALDLSGQLRKRDSDPTYEQAIRVARDLIEPGENAEYERGMAELIADLWGAEGVLLGDRAVQVMHDILSIDPMAPTAPANPEPRDLDALWKYVKALSEDLDDVRSEVDADTTDLTSRVVDLEREVSELEDRLRTLE